MSILDKTITKLGIGFAFTTSVAIPSLIANSRGIKIINLTKENKQLEIKNDEINKNKPQDDKSEVKVR